MVEKNMITLTERTIMKSRSGVYSDTAENRRKHRVGQKYGAEKQSDDGEKTEKKEADPEKELEAINKVIAAVNEGKLKLPPEEINTLVAKKTMAEEAVKQAKGEKKPEEKEESKKGATKPEEKSEGKQYASMDIKEAKKELVGKKITIKKYFFDGIDSYKDAEGEIKKVRLYGKEKQPIAEIDFPNGDGITISLEQLDKRKAMQYEIEFNDSKSEEPKQEASGQASETDKKINEASKRKKYGDMNVEEAKKELLGKDLTITDIETGKTRTEKITSILEGNVRGHETVMARVEGGGTYPIKQINTGKAWKAWKYEIEFNDSKSEEPKSDHIKLTFEQLRKEINELGHILSGRIKDGRRTEDVEKRISDMLKYVSDKELESTLESLKNSINPTPTTKIAAKLTEMEINRRKTEGSTKQTEKKEETTKEEPKSEPKQGETEESYTRVKFDDVPNSGKVNLKKYLSDKVRNQADENLGVLSKVSFENLQTMEKGLVKEFNSQFGSLSKSRRAENFILL